MGCPKEFPTINQVFFEPISNKYVSTPKAATIHTITFFIHTTHMDMIFHYFGLSFPRKCDFIIHYNRIVFRLYIVGVKKHKTTQFYYILYSRIMFLLLYLGQTFFHYKSIFVIIIKGCKKIKTKTQFRY